jgi:hypothetical protein
MSYGGLGWPGSRRITSKEVFDPVGSNKSSMAEAFISSSTKGCAQASRASRGAMMRRPSGRRPQVDHAHLWCNRRHRKGPLVSVTCGCVVQCT